MDIGCGQVPFLLPVHRAHVKAVSPVTGFGSRLTQPSTCIVLLCLGLLCVSSVAVSTPPPAASRSQRHCVAAVLIDVVDATLFYLSCFVLLYFRLKFPFIFIQLVVHDWVDAPGVEMHGAALPQRHLFGGLVTSPGFLLGARQFLYFIFVFFLAAGLSPFNRVHL